MALNPVPQKQTLLESDGYLTPVWLKFFRSIFREIQDLSENGVSSETGSDAVFDGGRRLTGSSFFDGGRRV